MILDNFFSLMAEKRASDIFISAGTPVRIKIRGDTHPINQQMMEPAMIEKIAYELMTPAQIRIFETTMEMNLSHGVPHLGNFRVSLFRQRGSISIVVRYILSNIPELKTLALPPLLSDLVMEKRGLILVVGATGSGKSTTIAAMLDHRNEHRTGHILTIEDPIEFLFRHKKSVVNQRELGVDTKDWASALRNAMRQAPDCILIGEIRDQETMQAAIAYAQTGHLCLATLHANNSYHALSRIINFFPLDNRMALYLDLSASLKAIISQRLIKKIDGQQTPTTEILLNTRHIQELIEHGEILAIQEAMEQSLAPGSQTFEQDLFRLYRTNTISLDEALVNSDSPTNLSWLINNAQAASDSQWQATHGKDSFEPTETKDTGSSFKEFTLDFTEAEPIPADATVDAPS